MIGGEDLTLRVIHRLIEAGCPATRVAEIFDISEEVIYYRGTPKRELYSSGRIDFSVLERAEELIREGHPADVVAFAAGIPLKQLLDYLGIGRKAGKENRE